MKIQPNAGLDHIWVLTPKTEKVLCKKFRAIGIAGISINSLVGLKIPSE